MVEIGRLANGLRVVSDPMPGVETVSVGIWVDAGARLETPAETGVAHVLEHMLFKGTHRRGARAIAAEIEAVGGHLNAYTGRETTAFHAKLLKEDLALGFDILADMLTDPVLDPTELERERGVILQEIGQAEDTPDDIIFDHWQETAFPDQPLGRPVLGTPDIVAGLPRDAVAGFRGRHYGADRMVVVASGNLEHARLMDLAERHLGAARPVGAPDWGSAAYVGGERRWARDLEQLHLVLGFPAPPVIDDAASASAGVLATLLGGGMSSRLFQDIREERGLVYSIHAFANGYRDQGLFGIYAGTGEEEAAELIPVLCDALMAVTHSVEEEEVARAKAQMRSGLLMSLESSSARADQIGGQMLLFGRPRGAAELTALIDAVTPDDVTAMAARLFAARPTLVTIGPDGHVGDYDALARRLVA